MICYLNARTAKCPTCKQTFEYDVTTARRPQGVCDSCKAPIYIPVGLQIRTHEEVAKILGISPEAVRMSERSALLKIRKGMKKLFTAVHRAQLT